MKLNRFLINGFTLIELIMTILLIGIVIIPSSIFIIESVRGAFKSEDIIIAVNLARMELEKINNLTYDHTDMLIGTTDVSKYNGYNYDLRRTVIYIEYKPPWKESVKEIRVEVYPAGKLGNTQYLLTTVITHRAKNAD